jgi:capsular exopolysaccharide synthesis family protein
MITDETPRESALPASRKRFAQEESLDWRALVVALREKLWVVIVTTCIGAGVGWAYLKRSQPVYEARATLEVEDKQRVVKFEEVSTSEVRDVSTMNTVAATILSPTFLASLAAHDKFHERPGFFGEWNASRAPALEDAAGVLGGALRGSVRQNTRLIDITARHSSPEFARDIADGAAKGIIRFGMEQRAQVAMLANEFLAQEAARLKNKLEASEMALQRYRDENKAVSLGDNQNLVVAQMNDVNAKFGTATAERVQLEADVAALKSYAARPEEAIGLRSVASHPTVAALTQAIAQKKSELAVIKNRYKTKHPKYIALQTELTSLEQQFAKAIPDVATQLESSFAAAKANEETYRQALAEHEQKALALDRLGVKFKVLTRDVESDKSLYETVLSRMKEVDLTKGMEMNSLRLHANASMPGGPAWPVPSKIFGSSIAGGLMAGVILVWLLFFMDRSIKTVDQAEKTLGLPVMSAVTMKKGAGLGGALEAWKEPHGAVAESFRSLRAMATLLGREEDRRTFLITSAVPSEGKTFCSSNYALSLALQGKRTLLVDADLRRPRVSAAFFGENRKPGLTEYLIGKSTLGEAAHDTEVELLKIMPAGERSPNPAELLTEKGIRELLEESLKHYDRVIFDTAPVVAVSDTLLIAPQVDTVFLVAQWGKTPITVVQRAVNMLRSAGKAPSGLVLNQLPGNSRSYYYHYSPGYYGSKGVYSAPA